MNEGIQTIKVASLNIWKKSRIKLIPEGSTELTREQRDPYENLQEVFNDLNRKRSNYGDGSVAIIIILEQLAGGLGNEPTTIPGVGKLHETKGQDYIVAINRRLKEHGSNVVRVARQKLEDEIQKLQDALKFAQEYKQGNDIGYPRWASSGDNYTAINKILNNS